MKIDAPGLFEMGRLQDAGGTRILIGANADFWPVFTKSREYQDGRRDPVDRWSKRVIGALARALGATADYPSDGPPYAPFIDWALRSGRFWQSPTGMMIHDRAGLMISLRGAMLVPELLPLAPKQPSPCKACRTKPCIAACPVDALSDRHAYKVPACKEFLAAPAGQTCMLEGCLVRRACPVSQRFDRDPAQSAFHMNAFVGAGPSNN